MKILTEYLHPPVPYRHMDWVAYIEGEEENNINGWGKTEEEAIKDLQDNLTTLEEHYS